MLHVAIIDPSGERRLHLRAALRGNPNVSSVQSFRSIDEVESTLVEDGSLWDIVFVSSRLDRKSRNRVRQISRSEIAKRSSFIMLLEDQPRASLVAGSIIEGFTAVLIEPFSLITLEEIISLALKKGEHCRMQQQRRAVELLVREIMDQLNEVAKLQRNGHSARVSLHLLQEMCSILKTLDTASLRMFYETLLLRSSRSSTPNMVGSIETKEDLNY